MKNPDRWYFQKTWTRGRSTRMEQKTKLVVPKAFLKGTETKSKDNFHHKKWRYVSAIARHFVRCGVLIINDIEISNIFAWLISFPRILLWKMEGVYGVKRQPGVVVFIWKPCGRGYGVLGTWTSLEKALEHHYCIEKRETFEHSTAADNCKILG